MSNNNNDSFNFKPGMFSSPPPMLNNASNWNGFKYPQQQQFPSSPRYRNVLEKNGESPHKRSPGPMGNTELSSPSNNNFMNSNVAHAQGSPMKSFEFPPPPIDTRPSYAMNPSMQSLPSTGFEGNPKISLFMYRLNPAQYSYPMASTHPNPYQLGASLQFSSSQPPLPPVPPPENPPPPPPPSTITAQSHQAMLQTSHYAMYNRIPFNPMFGNQRQNMYKRRYDGDGKKLPKKKKKPLSQVVPQKRDWSLAEARKALDVEKECNKNNKRQGLIIKFPDVELNRDIVSNFHSSIDSVHFQQPSTPRYCFITLRESADPETVIKQLNQIPFGLGFLTAEFKKDREDEQNLQPSDIDPLTLYVGNLAQEITKEDIIKTYPKQKRIDIGYAKKMKYTRYAFVSFYNVDDAVQAFQNTHSTQLYSKSLIVRFRRLHGTVGLPGETKQNTPRSESTSTITSESVSDNQELDVSSWHSEEGIPEETQLKSESPYTSDEEEHEELLFSPVNLRLKQESFDSRVEQHGPVSIRDEGNIKQPRSPLKNKLKPGPVVGTIDQHRSVPIEEDEDIKPPRPPLKTNFLPGSIELGKQQYRPIPIKEDKDFLEIDLSLADSASESPRTHNTNSNNDTKPNISHIKQERSKVYSNTSYEHLRILHKQLRNGPIQVKNENDMIRRENCEPSDRLSAESEQSTSRPVTDDRVSEKGRTLTQRNKDVDLPRDRVVNRNKEIEKTARMDKTSDSNTLSNWDNLDFSPVAVKTEKGVETEKDNYDDDSSDDDGMSMEQLLAQAKRRAAQK
ncbi:uncharacterized protein LOC114324244 isoform X1 [Diabrotica virgifera virgifera]|uniref:RRM domain-containing protein n=1 Tax=Diabrotica virgifera virgifera TaxID=50390 RepID=A0ABM5I984_DIAVI|nr:uncharacterized protein LOC114324244 isoform X1 [Diabrotica virgifera virgifera]